jgi:long-subunit acyl-CoA synthetase (AMP-forming)
MGGLTLYTSGSTDEPKRVFHTWQSINHCVQNSIDEIKLTSSDRVLDVYPANTIAHYTITAYPAIKSGSFLYSTMFNPYSYIKIFKEINPTYISLIPKHLELLSKTKEFFNLDMSSVRYMATGSSKITQEFIDTFRNQGVKLIANWYGMTEMPPPVFVGYNTESFDFIPKPGYKIEFSNEGECIINGIYTGDIFDTSTKKFLKRKLTANGSTWKTNV